MVLSASMFGIGAIFGGLISGYLGSKFGSMRSLSILAFVDIVHWIMIATATNFTMFMIGR